jgi:polyphosphate kinase
VGKPTAAKGSEPMNHAQPQTVLDDEDTEIETVDTVAPVADDDIDLDDPALYLNRELTWLGFNRRVLNEADDPRTPLLERVKFLAIVSNNLDEFFMKRIGGLKQQIAAGVHTPTVDGRTPNQQLADCRAVIAEIKADQDRIYKAVMAELEAYDIRLVTIDSLPKDVRERMR